MAEQIEVYPDKSGGWRWRHGDKPGKPSAEFETRNEAFADALLERESEAVVLLRADGSLHGELYHERREGGPPQRVDLLAVSTRDDAQKMGG